MISGYSDIFVIKRIAKRKIRFEKIVLELIMSDIANGHLGALIFLPWLGILSARRVLSSINS